MCGSCDISAPEGLCREGESPGAALPDLNSRRRLVCAPVRHHPLGAARPAAEQGSERCGAVAVTCRAGRTPVTVRRGTSAPERPAFLARRLKARPSSPRTW
ncbi:hypothetical protein GCM10010336_72290 [Streptomyces goshikiensis]|nr:hypothetical protein GCM10010336_72290 [Streptomyces goshikiensis]